MSVVYKKNLIIMTEPSVYECWKTIAWNMGFFQALCHNRWFLTATVFYNFLHQLYLQFCLCLFMAISLHRRKFTFHNLWAAYPFQVLTVEKCSSCVVCCTMWYIMPSLSLSFPFPWAPIDLGWTLMSEAHVYGFMSIKHLLCSCVGGKLKIIKNPNYGTKMEDLKL